MIAELYAKCVSYNYSAYMKYKVEMVMACFSDEGLHIAKDCTF